MTLKIRLRGLVDKAFGGYLCVRGYAPIGVLADASEIEDYQRQADENHVREIREFLEDINHSFFPELILGISLEELGLDAEKRSQFYEMMNEPIGVATKRLSDGFVIGLSSIPAGSSDRVISLRLECRDHIFKRIDGNHRLEAVPAEGDEDGYDIRDRIVPYCIVLFETAGKTLYNGTMFFHNINYRALPIPEEKSLQVILEKTDIEGSHVFTDDTLLKAKFFGKPYYYARKFLEWVDFSAFPFVWDLIKNYKRSISVQLFKELCRLVGENEVVVTIAVHSLPRLEMLVRKNWTRANYDIGVIVALFYFAIVDDGKDAEVFSSWIDAYGLNSLQGTSATDVISLFEKTHRRGPYKVFVAMPYVSNPHVNDFNRLFKEVLSELSDPKGNSDGIKYELIPIMRFRGAAQRIDRRLIEKIKECDIFIADITGNNENVIFEVGLAEGNGKQMLLIRSNDDSKPDKVFGENEEYVKSGGRVPFDMDKLQYIPYSATGYYNSIKSIVKNHLPEIAKKLG